MPPEFTPYALLLISAALIPGGVALVKMRRDTDKNETRIAELEKRTERHGNEIDGTRSLIHQVELTMVAGFAELKALITRARD